MNSDLDYCRELAARHDYGRYLASLVMPRRAREALWPTLALGHVLSGIRDSVSDPTIGYIRLVWWRDEIGKLGTYPAADPVLRTLAGLAAKRGLTPAHFAPLLDSHEAAMEHTGIEAHVQNAEEPGFDQLVRAALDDADHARWRRTDAARARMMDKARGTKWDGHPPFFALRLFLTAAFGRGG